MVRYHFLHRLQDGSVLSKSEETNNTISPGPGIVLASLVALASPGSAPRVFAKVQNAWNEKGPYDLIEEGVEYGVLLPQEDELYQAVRWPAVVTTILNLDLYMACQWSLW